MMLPPGKKNTTPGLTPTYQPDRESVKARAGAKPALCCAQPGAHVESYDLSLEAIADWCIRSGGRTAHGTEQPEILVMVGLFGQKLPVRVRALPSPLITLAIVAPFQVPAENLEETRRAAAVANQLIHMGTWIVLDTGELFFRVTLPTLGVKVDDRTLTEVVRLVIGTVAAAAPAFHAVANEGAPHDVVRDQTLARVTRARQPS